MKLDIVITGVGGQGNVLASRILAQTAMEAGYPVRTSEAIGMAQREGVVMSQVRIGDEARGALIPNGAGDVLLGMELAETVRGLPMLKKDAVVIANSATIIPVTAALGMSEYQTDELISYLKNNTAHLHLFDATSLAVEAGTFKATNIVLLGALASLNILPFTGEQLLDNILSAVPPKFKEINKLAFELGYKALEV